MSFSFKYAVLEFLRRIEEKVDRFLCPGGLTAAETTRVMAALKDLIETGTTGKENTIMANVSDMLTAIAAAKAKVIALQDQIRAGGMTAAEEAQVEAALADLSQTADPTVPNP